VSIDPGETTIDGNTSPAYRNTEPLYLYSDGSSWIVATDYAQLIAIPDTEVYLHDDWGDNKLQDRDDGGTTTYNGVEGVYRPEYTLDVGTPTAEDEMIILDGAGCYTPINLNLDETITWEWTHDISGTGTDGGDQNTVSLYAEDETTRGSASNGRPLASGYVVTMRGGGVFRLAEVDSAGDTSTIVTGDGANDEVEVKVTREPDGTWELFRDGESQGTGEDTAHTDPQVLGFGDSDSDSILRIKELKTF